MATQYHESGQLPDGIVVAHTLHGRPDESITHAYTAEHAGIEVIPAPYDGIPWYGDELDEAPPDHVAIPERAPERDKRCAAKNDTCMGWAIHGSEFCSAHAGVFRNPLGRRAWDPKFEEDETAEPTEGGTAEPSP
jgi:hypothetical protein